MSKPIAALRPFADKAAISLSALCVVHCLVMPLTAVLLPSLLAIGVEDELLHLWLVAAVIPLSVFALTLGCGKHRDKWVLGTGAFGLLILCLAALLGHDLLGEIGEKSLTLSGAALVAISHIRNFSLCREAPSCECAD
ncbi:MAG: MerC domain-containing protein [Pseudomonadota bacterium]